MSTLQELSHFGSSGVYTGQDGEDGFLAFEYLLVKHVVDVINRDQSGRTENHEDGINLRESFVAIFDGGTQLFGITRGKNVDGIGHRGTREELRLQFIGNGTFKLGHLQSALRKGIGKHHARTACMGDDSPTPALPKGEGERSGTKLPSLWEGPGVGHY